VKQNGSEPGPWSDSCFVLYGIPAPRKRSCRQASEWVATLRVRRNCAECELLSEAGFAATQLSTNTQGMFRGDKLARFYTVRVTLVVFFNTESTYAYSNLTTSFA